MCGYHCLIVTESKNLQSQSIKTSMRVNPLVYVTDWGELLIAGDTLLKVRDNYHTCVRPFINMKFLDWILFDDALCEGSRLWKLHILNDWNWDDVPTWLMLID